MMILNTIILSVQFLFILQFDLMVQNVTANTLTAYLEIADEINPNKAQQIKCHSKQTFEHGEKLMESIKSKMVGEGDQFGALSQNVFFVHAFDIEKRNWNMVRFAKIIFVIFKLPEI